MANCFRQVLLYHKDLLLVFSLTQTGVGNKMGLGTLDKSRISPRINFQRRLLVLLVLENNLCYRSYINQTVRSQHIKL